MNSHFQSSETTWTLTGFSLDTSGLGGSRSYEPTQATPPTRITVMIGIDQTSSSSRPEYSKSGIWRACLFDERNHQAAPSVARIVGITMASMIPVALSIMRRCAAATGPFGSSTPSEQPPSVIAPMRNPASARYRISGPPADRECCKQHKQVQNRKREQAMGRPPISLVAPGQSQREHNERRSTDGGGRAIDRAGKTERARQQRNREQQDAVNQDLPPGLGSAAHHRQHGDTGAGIIVDTIERQRPEMRRRPQEHDQEQDKRLKPEP